VSTSTSALVNNPIGSFQSLSCAVVAPPATGPRGDGLTGES
jgi:hypothetical protein